jgi:hypothetical protein
VLGTSLSLLVKWSSMSSAARFGFGAKQNRYLNRRRRSDEKIRSNPVDCGLQSATSSACFSAAANSADLQALLASAMCLTTAVVGTSLSRRSQRFVC